MKSTENWIEDWKCEIDPESEEKISKEIIDIFNEFWNWARIEEKSKTTQQRYYAALHALGGYLVEQAARENDTPLAAKELIRLYINADEGPLIHQQDEKWQNEIDMVCRKLHRYLTEPC